MATYSLSWIFELEAVCCEERTPSWVNFYGWTSELQVLIQPWTVVRDMDDWRSRRDQAKPCQAYQDNPGLPTS